MTAALRTDLGSMNSDGNVGPSGCSCRAARSSLGQRDDAGDERLGRGDQGEHDVTARFVSSAWARPQAAPRRASSSHGGLRPPARRSGGGPGSWPSAARQGRRRRRMPRRDASADPRQSVSHRHERNADGVLLPAKRLSHTILLSTDVDCRRRRGTVVRSLLDGQDRWRSPDVRRPQEGRPRQTWPPAGSSPVVHG